MKDDQMVETTIGLIPLSELEIREIKAAGDNELAVAREWYHRGIMVRRDAWVTQLRGHSTSIKGNFHGGK